MITIQGNGKTIFGPNIVTDGLVLYLDAANINSYVSGDTIWNDLSGNGNNASLKNNPVYDDGSILFVSTNNNYVDNNFDLSWNETNSISISFFVKPSSLIQNGGILGKSNYEWTFKHGTTQSATPSKDLIFVYWDVNGTHTNGPIMIVSNFFDTLNWVNITFVWNNISKISYIYKNGNLVSQSIVWSNPSVNRNLSSSFNMGGNIYTWSTVTYWSGNISNLQIWNKALSSTEILQNYNAVKSRFGLI